MIKSKIIISILLLFCWIGCKNEKSARPIIPNQKAKDSIALEKEKDKRYKITTDNNKKILTTVVFENRTYNKENDFTKIKSILLKTPSDIDLTYLRILDYRKEVMIFSFGLMNYLEYKEPYREYCPFINGSTNEMEFIVSYDTPVKISFKKGQYFYFGQNYKWLTPKIKVAHSIDHQYYNKKSFKDLNPEFIHHGMIIRFKNKKYLLFLIGDGMWWIHHLFDITDESNIKYYILNSIYGLEECYGDFNNDGKLDFKQKYAYLRNSEDKSQDKYKVYTLPE